MLLTLLSASPHLFFNFKVYSPVSSLVHFGICNVTLLSVNLSAAGPLVIVHLILESSGGIS